MALDITYILIQLVTVIVMIPLSAALLMLTTMMFKLKDKSYLTALKVAAIVGPAGLVLNILLTALGLNTIVISLISILLVSIILAVYLVFLFYKLDFGKALLVWLVWMALSFVIGMIVGLILAMIFVMIGFGVGMAGLA